MIICLAVKTGRLEDGGFSKNLQFFTRRCVKKSKTHRKNAEYLKEKGPHDGGLSCSWQCALALQQAEHALLRGICLRQHRHRCLLQNLRLGKVGAFRREVGILNAASRSLDVRRDVG